METLLDPNRVFIRLFPWSPSQTQIAINDGRINPESSFVYDTSEFPFHSEYDLGGKEEIKMLRVDCKKRPPAWTKREKDKNKR